MDRQIVLGDNTIYPTEEVIFSHIGTKKTHWISLFDFLHSEYPAFTEQWKYYNDGKSWLLKVTKKSGTVFWLSLIDKTFRVTFYFNNKYERQILDSPISDELKEEYRANKNFNKIRAITVYVKNKKCLDDIKILIGKKMELK
ncbi:MAG TPA: DUF3788 family protein [Bacteroidota bacterium]|nr:DUF3788 family protein [Bacteroidota bacterium]